MNNRYINQNSNTDRNATWRVGVYCRLSKDDELTGESASISNQRDSRSWMFFRMTVIQV